MSKMVFLKMPRAAMFDKRLTRSDLAMLGAIAYHDRTSDAGRGCFAAVGTLAQMAGLPLKSAERSMQKLRTLKYIRVEKDREDGRQRTYRIAYNVEAPPITPTVEGDFSANDPHSCDKSPSEFEKSPNENQGVRGGKQSHKHIPRIGEAYSDESASFSRNDVDPQESKKGQTFSQRCGAYLRKTEAAMGGMTPQERDERSDDLRTLIENLDYQDPLCQWAARLADELEWLNHPEQAVEQSA